MAAYDSLISKAVEFLTPTNVAMIAAAASTISAISSWRSSRAAKDNLRMAKIEFEERHDSIHAHLIDGIAWDSPEGERIASFACTYSNAANAPNTMVRVELVVRALNEDGTSTTVVLDPSSEDIPSSRNMPQLSVPLNLQARATASGWVSFKLPAYLLDTKRIDKYQVTATTSAGKEIVLDCHLLRKDRHEVRKDRTD